LLAPRNVNTERLVEYALDAVKFGTEGKLTNMEFKIERGKPDIAVFDFTSLKKAEHAARIIERKGHRLLLALVGDSLIEVSGSFITISTVTLSSPSLSLPSSSSLSLPSPSSPSPSLPLSSSSLSLPSSPSLPLSSLSSSPPYPSLLLSYLTTANLI
jgi:hypothetical protein